MRPNPHFQQILDESKVAAGFGSREKENEDSFRRPLLSLHVRHKFTQILYYSHVALSEWL